MEAVIGWSPLRISLVVLLVWAGIYLPALGTLELKGEEARRAMPGVAMLQTGDWIVPEVGGEDYLRKPPLVNWAVACAVRALGAKNEWTVRIPSVAAVLLLGLAIALGARGWLGREGALAAAVFALTNISMMEKGRLIEIEAIYISLTGIATIAWLGLWLGKRPPWLVWPLPAAILGVSILAKGPVNLVFYYAVVGAVLFHQSRAGERRAGWRALAHPAHWLALAVMVAIFAAWAVPFLHATAGGEQATGVAWREQFAGRVRGDDFRFGQWLVNIPRSVGNFLPWIVFLPLAWRRGFVDGLDPWLRPAARGIRDGMAVSFVVMTLLPGAVPRYTLPLMTAFSLVIALCFFGRAAPVAPAWTAPVWRRVIQVAAALGAVAALGAPFLGGWGVGWIMLSVGAIFLGAAVFAAARRLERPLSLVLLSGLVMVLVTIVFSLGAVPLMARDEKFRPAGWMISAAVPAGETLYVFDPGYQPLLFYIDHPITYVLTTSGVEGSGMRWLLVREKHLPKVLRQQAWLAAVRQLELPDIDGKPIVLLRREGTGL